MIDAAEIDQVRLSRFQWYDHRGKVCPLFSAVVAQDIESQLLGFVAEVVRHALTVQRLVMNNIDRFEFKVLGGKAGPYRSLDIVAAANAIDIGIPTIGNLGC